MARPPSARSHPSVAPSAVVGSQCLIPAVSLRACGSVFPDYGGCAGSNSTGIIKSLGIFPRGLTASFWILARTRASSHVVRSGISDRNAFVWWRPTPNWRKACAIGLGLCPGTKWLRRPSLTGPERWISTSTSIALPARFFLCTGRHARSSTVRSVNRRS